MQETVEETKEKVAEMAATVKSLQMSISLLQESHTHLLETFQVIIAW